jgi:hypothetical protein
MTMPPIAAPFKKVRIAGRVGPQPTLGRHPNLLDPPITTTRHLAALSTETGRHHVMNITARRVMNHKSIGRSSGGIVSNASTFSLNRLQPRTVRKAR